MRGHIRCRSDFGDQREWHNCIDTVHLKSLIDPIFQREGLRRFQDNVDPISFRLIISKPKILALKAYLPRLRPFISSFRLSIWTCRSINLSAMGSGIWM